MLDAGNPINPPANFPVVGAYPLGTAAAPNYGGYAYDFGVHYSPDGAIEYQGSAFNGALNGALLITRYSGGKDIIVLRTDPVTGAITSAETGIAGFTQFDGPVDIDRRTRAPAICTSPTWPRESSSFFAPSTMVEPLRSARPTFISTTPSTHPPAHHRH